MVWGFFPVESLPGEESYYIFSKGTYKVGRKGCDVIINTDKGVSRIHAEVIIDSMASLDPLQRKSRSTNFSSNVRIKDCSKYGTFINKKTAACTKVSEHPNKEAPLKHGDLLSFGTGNATYKFCFVPLLIFMHGSKAKHIDRSLQEDISLIGARATCSWTTECTHVLVEESMPIKEDLINAIVAQKPCILKSWLKVVAEKKIGIEIPSCDNYIPTLTLEGLPVKLVVPKVRENCAAGYKFLLGSLELYKFGDKLRSLSEVAGAKVLSVTEFCSSSEMSEDGANIRKVLVKPPVSGNSFDNLQQLRSLLRVNEISLVLAILSGHLDQSIMESPPITVSSSCSTDETIVEDSDVEMDIVTSRSAGQSYKAEETMKHNAEEQISEHHLGIEAEKVEVSRKDSDEEQLSVHHLKTEAKKVEFPSSKVENSGMVGRSVDVNRLENPSDHSSDIIYSQDLIVRDTKGAAPARSKNTGVINFKCFRKRETPCGNSFENLIPFAQNPYRESDYGNEKVAEHVREENKRKQLEALAEDLFHNEKAKRRKAGGDSSIRGILSRG